MRSVCLAMSVYWYIVTVCLGCVIATSVADIKSCYLASPDWCPRNGSRCLTNDSEMGGAVQMYCCNITSLSEIESAMENTKKLLGFHLRDSELKELSMNFFDKMKDLTSLSITNCKFHRLIKGFEESHPSLTCLNISDNILPEFGNINMLTKLTALKMLSVVNNTNMTTLPHLPTMENSFIELDVASNKYLNCKSLVNLTEYLYLQKIRINQINKDRTICLPPNLVFNEPYYVTMKQIDQTAEIYRNCPIGEFANCSCEVATLDEISNNAPAYQAFVNCSGRQLTALPKILPPYTRILDVSNNSITSLEGISNSTYSNILAFYADSNQITTLKPLEGTLFLENVHNLSLVNNKIDEIPRHIISNFFDRSKGFSRMVFLAKNILKCECETAYVTKNWLMRLSDNIPDYKELMANCDDIQIKVIEMNAKDYCPTNELQHYLKYVIIAEITLFVLLVAKVSYDYYVFKTAGYLPWPASKMPKLPCDWCFET